MIVDYGPLPEAATGPLLDILLGAALAAMLLLVIILCFGEKRWNRSGKVLPAIAITCFAVIILGVVFGMPISIIHGGQQDTIRDQHYPTILTEAGYTDLHKIDNSTYAAENPDGDTVIVDVQPITGFDNRFAVLETEN